MEKKEAILTANKVFGLIGIITSIATMIIGQAVTKIEIEEAVSNYMAEHK